MGEFISELLTSNGAIKVTDTFLWILAIVFAVALFSMVIGKWKKFVAYTPNLLTSIGILGTFIGIVIGLHGFDPANIDGSIEKLLAGLKTAFITSLAGMGLSIIYKMLSTTPLARVNKKSVEGKDIGPAMLEEMQKQREQLEGIRDAVAGEEESSLAGQMKLLRSDVNDNHRSQNKTNEASVKALNELTEYAKFQSDSFKQFSTELWGRLEDFAEMMSKSATEQVINALKEVIADFNKQLTEQFGENFKALDASVQKLVTWQENYRVQLEEMSDQYKQGVAAITITKASVQTISEESKKIPESMSALKSVIDVNQHQIDELSNHLNAFKDIRDKAVEAVPEIRSQVESTVSDVSNAAIAATEHHKQLLESSDAYIKEHDKVSRNLLEKYIENTQDSMSLVKSTLEKGAETFSDGITDSAEKVRDVISAGADEFNNKVQRLSENLTSTSDVLAEKSSVISQQLIDTVTDINVNTRDMVENLVTGNENLTKTLTSGTERIGESLTNSSNELNKVLTDTGREVLSASQEIQDEVASGIKQMQSQLEASLEEVFQTQTREMQRSYEGVNAAIEEAIKRTGDGVNSQLQLIDESMNKEVERVMNAMGTALASITGQFTNDYKQLVGAMQEVVVQGRAA